ncbi:WPP domain-associated protein-like isoform X2 [Nicotiana tabacum]|nr:PREDICTED: WPP domain-associated protein-like isoform X2 [Nicotiana tabacum]
MGILRSAMDKAHEKVQSEAGSIEFLHERSKFYELAVILVESGLSIVQEETDILESNREKVISDLTEMRHWLLGRIKVMKLLITEKDRELTERTENELKLRQILESKERELVFIREKLELQRTKSEGSQDLRLVLKNGAKEGETSDSKSDSELLNEGSCQNDLYGRYHIPEIKPMTDHSLRPEKNNVIQQMSSDIDILKETLDFAFGRRDNGEMVPLEKQWRCTIEKDTLSVLIKGFINDIQQRFESELRKRGDQIPLEFSNENLSESICEITALRHELETFYRRHEEERKTMNKKDILGQKLPKVRRTCSEPLPKVAHQLPDQEDQEAGGSNYVAKIKNHESIKKKQFEDRNCKSILHKKDMELDILDRMIKDVITRLDAIISSLNVKSVAKKHVKEEENFRKENLSNSFIGDKVESSDCACEILRDEVKLLNEEVDNLNLQISILEEIHLILYEGLLKDQNVAYFESIKNTKSTITFLLNQFDAKDENAETFIKGLKDGNILPETIGSTLKEDVYMVFFFEMVKEWKEEKDDFYMEIQIREDIYKFIMVEAVKDVHTKISEYLNPAYKKVEIDGTEESLIQKLDSLLKCLESEEDLMAKASSEIEEHNVRHEQEILECEEVEERETIEWLLNDDECTFTCVNEKLEIAMRQLSTSKELLFDLEQSLGISPDLLAKSTDDCLHTNRSVVSQTEEPKELNIGEVEDDKMSVINPSDVLVLAQLADFDQVIQKFEVNVVHNLDAKSSRVEELKHQFHNLIVKPVALIKKRKLLYKKAFLARCQNLKLAETEVDLLGDQVEALLHLLEKIYVILDQNSTVLSCHFQVFDILKLIKDKLGDAVACVSTS